MQNFRISKTYGISTRLIFYYENIAVTNNCSTSFSVKFPRPRFNKFPALKFTRRRRSIMHQVVTKEFPGSFSAGEKLVKNLETRFPWNCSGRSLRPARFTRSRWNSIPEEDFRPLFFFFSLAKYLSRCVPVRSSRKRVSSGDLAPPRTRLLWESNRKFFPALNRVLPAQKGSGGW